MFENFIGHDRPLSWTFQFWPVIVLSFLCSFAATWLCKKVALKFGIVDKPDNTVKTHKEPVAYLGGVGILVGFTVSILAGIYCIRGQEYLAGAMKWLLGILAGASIACFVGVVDDIFNLSPGRKMLGQIVAAIALILVGVMPALHYSAYYLGWQMSQSAEWVLGIIVVVFFVLGATNSLNLLDGLDGLCGGVTAIITIAQLLLAVHLSTWKVSEVGDPVRIIVCLGIVGGVCGFLPFNRHPAKIFMGDAGTMMLGFTMASLMILFAEQVPRWWMASIVVFGLPILDTATAMVRRVLNKRPLFVSDRGHIYDQLIDRGMSLNKTLFICYALAAVYALIGVTMSQIKTRYAAIVYCVVFVVSALVIWRRGFLEMEGLHGARRKTVSGCEND
jgi:UDP-GlcNAc:undecaprenyl-phosphate/decaprenyl-phosphate GlcNAc-1-phosphate transferase